MGEQHARIGRHAVAGFEQHDVAGHQFAGVDLPDRTIPAHARAGRQHVLERRQRVLGAVLLDEAERGVEQDDDEDDDGVADIADDAREHRRAEQDQDQQALELVEELEPRRPRRLLGEPVGAVAGEPRPGLGGREPPRQAAAEFGERRLGRQRMPRRIRGRRRGRRHHGAAHEPAPRARRARPGRSCRGTPAPWPRSAARSPTAMAMGIPVVSRCSPGRAVAAGW